MKTVKFHGGRLSKLVNKKNQGVGNLIENKRVHRNPYRSISRLDPKLYFLFSSRSVLAK